MAFYPGHPKPAGHPWFPVSNSLMLTFLFFQSLKYCPYFCNPFLDGLFFHTDLTFPFRSATMSTQRQQKYARLLQKEIGEIFQQDVKSLFGGTFITVSEVTVSPDFGIATVYLSLTLSKNPQAILEDIREKGKQIRLQLGARIRNQARIVPELRFFLDETLLEAEKMEKLLASLHIPPSTEE